MDREGVAAEFVFQGDFRAPELGFNTMNGTHPLEFVDAGVHAYDRWLADEFGASSDRFLLVGASGTYSDLDATINEINWIADHGFVGQFAPGFCWFEGMAPYYDDFYEPLWSLYEERGLVLVVHGGFGFDSGFRLPLGRSGDRRGRSERWRRDRSRGHAGSRRVQRRVLLRPALPASLVAVVARRGVRPPSRPQGDDDQGAGDWIPATLRRLDALYEEHRADLPGTRQPGSEYWPTNCMAGLSFMHRSEVEIRDEIGIDPINFGRDYPHTEGTWPNTLDYLKALFSGVPEDDIARCSERTPSVSSTSTGRSS